MNINTSIDAVTTTSLVIANAKDITVVGAVFLGITLGVEELG